MQFQNKDTQIKPTPADSFHYEKLEKSWLIFLLLHKRIGCFLVLSKFNKQEKWIIGNSSCLIIRSWQYRIVINYCITLILTLILYCYTRLCIKLFQLYSCLNSTQKNFVKNLQIFKKKCFRVYSNYLWLRIRIRTVRNWNAGNWLGK